MPESFTSLVWFSTITTTTQVLAGLVGLFAVFVVYKIQDTARMFEDVKAGAARAVSSYAQMNPSFPENISLIDAILIQDDELLTKFGAALRNHLNTKTLTVAETMTGADPVTGLVYGFNQETHDIYKKMLDGRRDIIADLKIALVVSFCEIAFCLILLTFSEYVMSGWLAACNTLLAIGVLGLLARATMRVAAR